MPALPIPRAPQRSPADSPESNEYRRALLDFRDEATAQALAELEANPEYSLIQKYIDAIEGTQWDRNRPKYRSKFVDNLIASARVDGLSQLTDIKPALDVYSKVQQFERSAEILNKTILHEWRRNNFDLKLCAVADHAMFGVGYWKLGAFSPGQLTATPCGMDTVMPIHCGGDIQSSTAIRYATHKPVQHFMDSYGLSYEELKPYCSNYLLGGSNSMLYDRPGHVNEYTWSNFSPAMKRWMGMRKGPIRPSDTQSPFPVVELQEFWLDDHSVNDTREDMIIHNPYLELDQHNYWYTVKPGQRMYPRKRLLVFAGDLPVYDGPSPYWHGLYPFARLCLNPVVWAPGGLSKYRSLMPFNQATNEVGAGILDTIKRALNQQMASKKGSVSDAAWDKFFPDLPGQKLQMNPSANVSTDVRYMDPPQLPAYVMNALLQYFLPQFQRHSGQVDVHGLSKKKQAPGGDTIEQMRDLMTGPFRLESRYVETFLRDSGIQAASNVIQYFTARTRMRILGADGLTKEDFDFDPQEMAPATADKSSFWQMFSIDIAPGSLHGASKDREKQLAISLASRGFISVQELLRKLEWGNVPRIMEELRQERESGMFTPQAKASRGTRGQRNAQAA